MRHQASRGGKLAKRSRDSSAPLLEFWGWCRVSPLEEGWAASSQPPGEPGSAQLKGGR